MKHGWIYKKLGEVGEFTRCNGILKSDFVDHGMPCIHYGQIHTKFGVSTSSHLTEISESLYNKSNRASKGDIIIAITSEDLDGSCKCTVWMGNYDIAVGAHAAIYKHSLCPQYVAYYFRSKAFYVEKAKYARGFKVMEIKPKDIAEIPIPLPPLATQQAIVNELDNINNLIALKKQQLADYDKLAQSIFFEMFGDPVENEKGWVVKKLGEVCEIIAGGDKPSDLSDVKTDEYVFPVIANGDGEKGIMGYSKLCRVKADCVAIGARGASVGNCRIVRGGFTPVVRLITLVPKFMVNSIFLYHIARKIKYNSNGAGQAQLTVPNVSSVSIILPPLDLQQSFAKKIEAIEKQKAAVSKQITDLETLLASRMQHWFE